MSRQRIAGSLLAVLAPIGLLGTATLADRSLHHDGRPAAQTRVSPPRPQSAQTPSHLQPVAQPAEPTVSAQPPTALDMLHEIRRACPSPERAGGCSPRTLTASLADDLPAIRAHYDEIEQRYLDRFPSGDYVALHALGFLRSRRALPVLRASLLSEPSPTDWNLADPSEPASFYADEQFPRHLALMQAIESIEGAPIRDAFKLTRAERRRLSDTAARCHGAMSAQWLLYKLAGTPRPTFAQIRAHRSACDAAKHRE